MGVVSFNLDLEQAAALRRALLRTLTDDADPEAQAGGFDHPDAPILFGMVMELNRLLNDERPARAAAVVASGASAPPAPPATQWRVLRGGLGAD